ncbi:MAG: RNA 2',3'-cyclic phosphodiesterase [Candidatus Neomarinimicrobiota bacterium]|nr:RNA 2',3'-cyclic phosphodiesterase [Candidatus Neomarinimicrobiota bacterium]
MIEKLLRTFLAIPIPEEVKSKKKSFYSILENSGGKIQWVKNSNLHLTLKFLGPTPETSINKIRNVIGKIVTNNAPFNLLINDTGCFPTPKRPRILYMGVAGGLDPLLRLVHNIEEALDSMGFPKELQDYYPHITLARIKYPQEETPNIDLFMKSSYDAIDFPIDRVQFFSSELLSSGAIHTILDSVPLGETL